ncbi:type 2 periplasmic-binding domain-containing protein [Thiobacillus sp.]
MKLKLNQIAFAVATLAAGAAHAAAVTPDLVIKLDGATAVAQSVTDVASYLCKDGAGAATTKLMSNSSAKVSAVYCSAGVKAESGLPLATKVLVMKNNKDGSLETFDRALSRKAKTTLLKVAGLDDACGTTCATELVDADGGFSDVDADIWVARIDNVTGQPQFDPALVSGGYTVKSGFAGQGFGIVVTKALYDAMQVAQGLNDADDAPGPNQPNITSQQYASILSASGGYHIDWSPIVGAAGSGKAVNLCRRTNASGTQASMDAFFLGNPCTASNAPTFGALDPAYAGDSAPGEFEVIENPGTGDVKTCLSSRNAVADVNQFAIGVMSLENADTADYKYVKLDGVAPNEDATRRQSVVDGRYNFAEEMVLAYRNDAPANVKTYLSNFATVMGDPTKVTPLNGVFTIPGTSTHGAFPNRVHKGTRGGNACRPFQLYE